MSRYDDYESEMQRSAMPDLDVERLLAGDNPLGDEAADLVVLVSLMRADSLKAPSEEVVARVASQAASIARSSHGVTAPSPVPVRRSMWRLQPQLATIIAALLLVGAFSGVAVAADGAAPGDPLYGIDRALEKIGIGAGNAEERLEEARRLLSEGEAEEALRHTSQVLEDEEDPALGDARAAIDDATIQLEDDQPQPDDVADLLAFLKANLGKDVGVDGREFGQGVADLAHQIGPNDENGPPTSNPGQGNGNGNQGSANQDNGNGQSQSGNQGNGNGNGQSQGGGNQGNGNGNGGSGNDD
jgi:hypothetical protein